jgi:hypothetical protein
VYSENKPLSGFLLLKKATFEGAGMSIGIGEPLYIPAGGCTSPIKCIPGS